MHHHVDDKLCPWRPQEEYWTRLAKERPDRVHLSVPRRGMTRTTPSASLRGPVSPATVLESLGDLAQTIFCMACADRLELSLPRLHVGLWCGGYGHRCGARPGPVRRITVWVARSPSGDELQISDRPDEEEETMSEAGDT